MNSHHDDSENNQPLTTSIGRTASPLDDIGDKIFDNNWLMSLTKEELVSIVILLARNQLPNDPGSTQTQQGHVAIPFEQLSDTAGLLNVKTLSFSYLPINSSKSAEEIEHIRWQIILISPNPEHDPMGFYIIDDVVIGRAIEDVIPDIDTTDYLGTELGVSRQHALLRPSTTNLLLVDLGSTNGTFCNGERLTLGRSVSLHNNDVITLGRLHFKLKIVEAPAGANR